MPDMDVPSSPSRQLIGVDRHLGLTGWDSLSVVNLDDLEQAISSSGITGADVAVAILLVAVGVVAYLIAGKLLRRAFSGTRAVAPDLAEIATRVVQFLVLWVFIALAINVLGANAGWLTFLLIGLLAVGAFAAKPLLDGMVSSVAVAAHSAVNVGDDVEIGSIRGTVEGLERRSTVIRTVDGSRVHIPNSELVDMTIAVLTAGTERQSTIVFLIDPAVGADEVDLAVSQAAEAAGAAISLEGIRVDSLDRGIRVAVDFNHGSSITDERSATDSLNRSLIASLRDHGITPLR